MKLIRALIFSLTLIVPAIATDAAVSSADAGFMNAMKIVTGQKVEPKR